MALLSISSILTRPAAKLASQRCLTRYRLYSSHSSTNSLNWVEPESVDATNETYPNNISKELYHYRDPDTKWDDPQNRRNIGQTLHIDDDELNLWSPHYYDQVSDSTALKWQGIFFATIGAFSGICYFFFYPERNAVPRSYPDGLARDLGARSEEDAYLYRVRTDKNFYEK